MRSIWGGAVIAVALLVSSTPSTGAPLQAPPRHIVEESLARLSTSDRPPRVHWVAGRPTPSLVAGLRVPTVGASLRARAEGFVAAHPALVAAGPGALVYGGEQRGARVSSVRLEQRLDGLPVLDRGVTVALDSDGAVISLVDESVFVAGSRPALVRPASARISARAAVAAVARTSEEPVAAWRIEGEVALPVWVVHVARPGSLALWRVLVDAETGGVVSVRDEVRR